MASREDPVTRLQFKSFIDTQFDNGYAIASLGFVLLSSMLFCFNLLGAWDPAVMKLPLWYAKMIYGLGGISALVVYSGMVMGWSAFRYHYGQRWLRRALVIEVFGMGAHCVALGTLAVSTLFAGVEAAWIAPTSLFLLMPHLQLIRRLLTEWARFDLLQENYRQALRLIYISNGPVEGDAA